MAIQSICGAEAQRKGFPKFSTNQLVFHPSPSERDGPTDEEATTVLLWVKNEPFLNDENHFSLPEMMKVRKKLLINR